MSFRLKMIWNANENVGFRKLFQKWGLLKTLASKNRAEKSISVFWPSIWTISENASQSMRFQMKTSSVVWDGQNKTKTLL